MNSEATQWVKMAFAMNKIKNCKKFLKLKNAST